MTGMVRLELTFKELNLCFNEIDQISKPIGYTLGNISTFTSKIRN